MTNVTAGAYADVPLFLFHLLEFMGRMQTAGGLTDRCRHYIHYIHYIQGIRAHYQSESLPQPPAVKPVAYVKEAFSWPGAAGRAG
jgi:hypothetical protein